MPIYAYQVDPVHSGCDHCRDGFEVFQHMRDDSLAACPQCGAPIRKLVFLPQVSMPKTNSELKNLGFTKLVKRDDGVYENVTRASGETKYMERDKPETIPNLKGKISD